MATTKHIELVFDDGSKLSADIDLENLRAMVMFAQEQAVMADAQKTIADLKARKVSGVTVT